MALPGGVYQQPSTILHCYASSMAASLGLTPLSPVRRLVLGAAYPEDALTLTSLFLPEEAPLVLNAARLLILAETGQVLRQPTGTQTRGEEGGPREDGDEEGAGGVHRGRGETSADDAEAATTAKALQGHTGRRLLQGLLRGTVGAQGEGGGQADQWRTTKARRQSKRWDASGGTRTPLRRLMHELHAPRKEVQLALEGWPPETALLPSAPSDEGAAGVAAQRRGQGVRGMRRRPSSSIARSVLLAQWEVRSGGRAVRLAAETHGAPCNGYK